MTLLRHILDVGKQGSPPDPQYAGPPADPWLFDIGPGAEARAMAARLLDDDIARYGETAT